MSSAPSDLSIGNGIRQLSHDFSELVRSEVALAKTELQENISRLGTGAGLLGGAGVIGLFAVEFVLLALMFGMIALGLSAWAAALVVGVVLGLAAAILAMKGKKNVSNASLAPTRTIEHVKNDAQSDLDRLRRRS